MIARRPRLLSIAEVGDDEAVRLRKRVGVIAGYVTVIAPLTLPIQAPGHPLSWPLALGLSAFSAINLLVLAQTRRFDRYVVALIAAGAVFVPLATAIGGGIIGSSPGLVWAFLVPAYAIMALGPDRARAWFFAFLGSAGLMVAVDPLVRRTVDPQPYPLLLLGHALNAVIPLTITFLLLRYTDLRRREAETRVDELLMNAIPPTIAARLKRGERHIAESYPETTVLFADIVGFTPWTRRTDPERVVSLLDDLFTRLDGLAIAHGLEKIRTMGDSFMAVAGAPDPRPDHPGAAIELARAVIDEMAGWRADTSETLEVRVGLASGSVIGGVIGQRRMLFDVWGETVNTASRMESSGLPGRIQLAPSTKELIGDRYRLDERGRSQRYGADDDLSPRRVAGS
ncbi:MAG TPA: adenylate/guanylate cyclase domain-containing protein [Acidimicrobiia bacterium]|nr:adenylate/guanylate cyclase domain-containing protein [Acidimicrobiia bacterium]